MGKFNKSKEMKILISNLMNTLFQTLIKLGWDILFNSDENQKEL